MARHCEVDHKTVHTVRKNICANCTDTAAPIIPPAQRTVTRNGTLQGPAENTGRHAFDYKLDGRDLVTISAPGSDLTDVETRLKQQFGADRVSDVRPHMARTTDT